MTAVKLFHYSIEMKMSYKCKARIFNYIAKFVMKLPEFFTLDSVLMTPDVLSCAYNCYIEGKDKECPYSAPADETEAAGTMSAVVECFEDSNPAPDVLYEQIEEQLYVVGNAEHDDLFEQIEELLDVVGTSEKEAAASRSRHYHRNSGSDFEFF